MNKPETLHHPNLEHLTQLKDLELRKDRRTHHYYLVYDRGWMTKIYSPMFAHLEDLDEWCSKSDFECSLDLFPQRQQSGFLSTIWSKLWRST